NTGGLPEVVREGVTGMLRPVGDLEGMVRASVEILGDAARWRAMSEAGAADARERFARDQVVAQYEALYVDAVAAGASPPASKTPA
ncbi:MAG: N-acetyl-alpha-D-glucosaminyl L-malate synthase BshA, partial [Gemmatimonadaceae bacterium]